MPGTKQRVTIIGSGNWYVFTDSTSQFSLIQLMQYF